MSHDDLKAFPRERERVSDSAGRKNKDLEVNRAPFSMQCVVNQEVKEKDKKKEESKGSKKTAALYKNE